MGGVGSMLGVALLWGAPAQAALPHTVQPGETLWSIAAANNLTTRTVAVFNGISEDAMLIAGQTIQVPTVAEGAAALSAAGIDTSSTSAIASAPGMGAIPSPYGELYLAPGAAESWNAMRDSSIASYGIDLYPSGPMAAYRTYAQQAELYEAYLAGYGAPANPPGTSSHEVGTSVDVQTPEMRWVIDQIGAQFGWLKIHGPGEWWHVDYAGG